jgi:hypothetical protein
MTCHQKLLLIFIYFVTIGVIGHSGLRIRTKEPSDIRIIFFFFSFAMVATTLLAFTATNIGAINEVGQFQGKYGDFFRIALHEAIAINTGVYIFAGISVLITVPQLLNYFFSGLFGVGSIPVYTKQSIALLILGIVKGSAVAAGTLIAIAFYGHCNEWYGLELENTVSMCGFAFIMLMLSFVTALQYRDATDIGDLLLKTLNLPSKNFVANAHAWFTRVQ